MDERQEIPTDQELEAWNQRSGELVDEILDDEDTDPVGVAYSLWVSLIYLLVEAGWSHEQLASDLAHHANNHDVEGHA